MAVSWWLTNDALSAMRHIRVNIPARAVGGTIGYHDRDRCLVGEGDTAVFVKPEYRISVEEMVAAKSRGARVLVDFDGPHGRRASDKTVRDLGLDASRVPGPSP